MHIIHRMYCVVQHITHAPGDVWSLGVLLLEMHTR
jgi:hypothetical protein